MILKNEFTTILAAVFLLVSCNANNGKDNATAPKTAADSTKLITEKYAALLFDLSGSKSMQELICQGWQLEEDLEYFRFH